MANFLNPEAKFSKNLASGSDIIFPEAKKTLVETGVKISFALSVVIHTVIQVIELYFCGFRGEELITGRN